MRGNHLQAAPSGNRRGSIPACAGEPGAGAAIKALRWVYPRVCGGTARSSPRWSGSLGLSPRVRGNQVAEEPRAPDYGSIPACAGEPTAARTSALATWVYPRVCGGTSAQVERGSGKMGLSPRVRGNPANREAQAGALGSIPACAGEPTAQLTHGPGERVYPRVCGGTGLELRKWMEETGLSPRVRGNRARKRVRQCVPGSIPACAGEPAFANLLVVASPVYPRVCGGTRCRRLEGENGQGLSPRVRGNQQSVRPVLLCMGSIPACAGEPVPPFVLRWYVWVYPRVCGGTVAAAGLVTVMVGLSPRVRGNPGPNGGGNRTVGSIPACAGEPVADRRRSFADGVYPRVCGGTRAI